ncbi:MAG: T9SS type A sorting domain-containing protein [Candidatus Latescibacteria bacterium]|nr:T9SS type A sorting domain-containing protein [Candidatus Latescibacterota bacterium]
MVNYNLEVLEFLGAVSGKENLLSSKGGSTPLFLVISSKEKPGQVWIANALADSRAVSGSGILAELQFKLIGDYSSPSSLTLASVELFDGQLRKNSLSAEDLTDAKLEFAPKNYDLAQNYPNPFNAVTSIHYQLPEREVVSVEVYNTLGQLVRTLVGQEQPAGYYTVQWDGKDDFGREVTSGIYLYKIRAGN